MESGRLSERVKALVGTAEIAGIRQILCQSVLDIEKTRAATNRASQINIQWGAEFHRLDGPAFSAVVNFLVLLTQEDPEESWGRIAVTYELVYRFPPDEEFPDQALAKFAEVNGVFNAWPYFREFVQGQAGRMGLPPITVPLYRIQSEPEARWRENQAGSLPKAGETVWIFDEAKSSPERAVQKAVYSPDEEDTPRWLVDDEAVGSGRVSYWHPLTEQPPPPPKG